MLWLTFVVLSSANSLDMNSLEDERVLRVPLGTTLWGRQHALDRPTLPGAKGSRAARGGLRGFRQPLAPWRSERAGEPVPMTTALIDARDQYETTTPRFQLREDCGDFRRHGGASDRVSPTKRSPNPRRCLSYHGTVSLASCWAPTLKRTGRLMTSASIDASRG